MPKFKNSNETFVLIFKHCAILKNYPCFIHSSILALQLEEMDINGQLIDCHFFFVHFFMIYMKSPQAIIKLYPKIF